MAQSKSDCVYYIGTLGLIMIWRQIKVATKSEQVQELEEFFLQHEAQSVTYVDAKDTPMYEPKPGEIKLWPDTLVIALFNENQDISIIINKLKIQFPSLDSPDIEILADKEWERAWMDDFHPMKFGNKLWICPSWSDTPEPDAVNILLDPGLAFGTGTHPTTRLCLEWLDSLDLSNKTVVDFGCGSGILSIAALKLGAAKVVGIDIDPQAIQASEENAKRNNVGHLLELYLPESQPCMQADLVVANILASPLIELHSTITSYCKIGGLLVMSGILKEQSQQVVSAYAGNFKFEPIDHDQDWVRISGTRTK